MSFFSKIMDSMRLTSDDDYFLDDEYEDDEEEKKAPRKSLFAKKERDYEDDYDDYEESEQKNGSRFPANKSNPKVVAMKKTPQMQVSMLKPTSIDDAKEISDYLSDGRAVLINMEGIHMEEAQRIIDFSAGATYSMEGSLQKISNYIFIATPKSVELSGEFQEVLTKSGLDISGLNIRM